ncbi:hypothetical protein ABZT27_33645 [Streptomyces sp. NPDC005389]|uniref:hypothetical protein n=1 Tax=unclassified Streptomyces TaxID=2593676 RepID=UPI0033BEA2A5
MRLGLALPTFGPDAGPEGILHVSRTGEDTGSTGLEERIDLAGRFLEGVRRG